MTVIYTSKYYTIFQSDKDKCYYIDFGQKLVRLSFCQLLALREKISSIAIERHFFSDENKHGFEILMLCNKEHLFVLNTFEILDLNNLIQNSFSLIGISSTKPAFS